MAVPFKAKWADSPNGVPIWDSTRGFPASIPSIGKLEFFDSEAAANAALDRGEVGHAYIQEHGKRDDLSVLRALLTSELGGNYDTWEPSSPPQDGYPRLVRDNYKDAIIQRECQGNDLLNRLAGLCRDDPRNPGKPVKKEIKALNAKVGAVISPEKNTLEDWLKLSRIVKAHRDAKGMLKDHSYTEMREALCDWEELYVKDFGERLNSYSLLHTLTSGNASIFKDLTKKRELISKLFLTMSQNTYAGIFPSLNKI